MFDIVEEILGMSLKYLEEHLILYQFPVILTSARLRHNAGMSFRIP